MFKILPCFRIDPVEGLSRLDPYRGPEDPIIGQKFNPTHDPREQPTPQAIRNKGKLIEAGHSLTITAVKLKVHARVCVKVGGDEQPV